MEKYTIEFIIQALNEAGWKPIRSIEPWLIIPVESGAETYYLSLCIYENEKILFVKGLVYGSIEEKQEKILMEFIQTGNHRLPVSNFEYDLQNKELNCRSGIYLDNLKLTSQLIHNLVYEVYDNVKHYKPLVQAVFEKQKTLEDIFNGK